MSRLHGRLHILGRALPRLLTKPFRRKPVSLHRILIAHHLLLGDTLLLTPLIAKLRKVYPNAAITFACPKPVVPLYAGRPFGVDAIPFDPSDHHSVSRVLKSGPYDLALVTGDNRHAWLAFAAGSRWIVAHADDVPCWKNWPVDEAIPYPHEPAAWADMAARLIDGPPPCHYRVKDWPAPQAVPFSKPAGAYIVLHPGASTAVKHWPSERWLALAAQLAETGMTPVWSGGPGESEMVTAIDPQGRYRSYAAQLDLAQLWELLAGARALVCPDTGVAHLGRLVGVPTLVLFGPGNAFIHGAGEYWSDAPYQTVTIADMPCRDQPFLFRRKRAWVKRCDRNTQTCLRMEQGYAGCMSGLSEPDVFGRLQGLLKSFH